MLIENASATGSSGPLGAQAAVDSGDILTVSEELVLESRDTTSLDARLLRAFDQNRRRLSLKLCEHEGLFAGFDILEFFHVPAAPRMRVRITASVREDRGTLHAVEYRAILADGHESGAGFVLARAAGWTLTPTGASAAVPVHIPPANYSS